MNKKSLIRITKISVLILIPIILILLVPIILSDNLPLVQEETNISIVRTANSNIYNNGDGTYTIAYGDYNMLEEELYDYRINETKQRCIEYDFPENYYVCIEWEDYIEEVHYYNFPKYVPFNEVVDFKVNGDGFRIEWYDYAINISVLVDYAGNNYTIQKIKNVYPNVNYKKFFTKHDSYHKYGFNISAIPSNIQDEINYIILYIDSIEGFGSDNVSLDIPNAKLYLPANVISDFSDLKTNFDLNLQNKRTLLIGNVSGKSELWLDPTIEFTAGNVSYDGFINYGGGACYAGGAGCWAGGSDLKLGDCGSGGTCYNYPWIVFNVSDIPDGAIINYANLSLYHTQGGAASPGNVNWKELNSTLDVFLGCTAPGDGEPLKTDITDGDDFTEIINVNTGSKWYNWSINTAGLTNITPQSGNDNEYFAIGTSDYVDMVCGHFSDVESASDPQLWVTYVLPVEIIYPVDNTHYICDRNNLNYTIYFDNPDSCWYSLDNGIINSTVIVAGTNWTEILPTYGNQNWTVYCNDTSNTLYSSKINITIGTTACGQSYESNKRCQLANDIINAATSLCINIQGATIKNMVFEGNNFLIDGNDVADFGVVLQTATEGTLTNNTIQNFRMGGWDTDAIHVDKVTNDTIRNIHVDENVNQDYGLYMERPWHCTITNVTSNYSKTGFRMKYGKSTVITNSTFVIGWSATANTLEITDSYLSSFYNNYINYSTYSIDTLVYSQYGNNTWNMTKESGANIIGEDYMGGNYWANSTGTGWSETCADDNGDGLCDLQFNVSGTVGNNYDYLPLTTTEADIRKNSTESFFIGIVAGRLSPSLKVLENAFLDFFDASELGGRILYGFRWFGEAIDLSELLDRVFFLMKLPLVALDINSLSIRTSLMWKSFLDSFTLSEFTNVYLSWLENLLDNFEIGEFITTRFYLVKDFLQDVTISELVTAPFLKLFSLFQGIDVSELITTQFSWLSNILTNLEFGEIITTRFNLMRVFLNDLQLGELVTRTSLMWKSFLNSFITGDLISIEFKSIRSLFDNLQINDLVVRTSLMWKSFLDNLQVNDLLVRTSLMWKSFLDSFTLSELTPISLSWLSNLLDNLQVNDLVVRTSLMWKSFLDNLQINDLVVRTSLMWKSFLDNLQVNDLVVRTSLMWKSFLDSFTIGEFSTVSLGWLSNLLDNLQVNDLLVRTSLMWKSFLDSFNFNTLIIRSSGLGYSFLENLEFSELMSTRFGLTKDFLVSFKVSEFVSDSYHFLRNFLLNLNIFNLLKSIFIDLSGFVLVIVSPDPITYQINDIDFNVTAAERLTWCGFSLNGAANVSMDEYNLTYYNYTYEGLIDGTYDLDFSCNDTNNNFAFASVRFGVDTNPPQVTLVWPQHLSTHTNWSINFTFIPYHASGIDTCELWGNWTGTFALNYTWITPTSGQQTTLNQNLTRGGYNWIVWCNSTLSTSDWSAQGNLTFYLVDFYDITSDLNVPFNFIVTKSWALIRIVYQAVDVNIILLRVRSLFRDFLLELLFLAQKYEFELVTELATEQNLWLVLLFIFFVLLVTSFVWENYYFMLAAGSQMILMGLWVFGSGISIYSVSEYWVYPIAWIFTGLGLILVLSASFGLLRLAEGEEDEEDEEEQEEEEEE